jgi:uncharacterized protein YlxW (UPF0749 family)
MDGTPIRIRRSAVPGKRPTADQLLSAELAYNTYDGELTAKRDRPGIGADIIRIGSGATVTNIIYVTKDGNDTNTGLKLGDAKRTIGAALTQATTGSVIKVSAGSYIENNPLTIPEQVSIVGDSLREVSVSPQNADQDLFYVANGVYVAEMSYTGTMNPGGAIFSFNPDEIGYFDQSPYIQNGTNFIPGSIGMRIDGSKAIGPLKCMVLDSYTQYNQGGIGISITNEGYAQLVSLFTICSDIAVFCGSGAACDLTNSNSSFGTYGLVADGLGPLKYTGIITGSPSSINDDTFTVDLNVPTLNITNAIYDNVTGLLTAYTSSPHRFSVGMGITLSRLEFVCPYEPGSRLYPSGQKGYVFEAKTVAPGRYYDSYNLIQANKVEIQDKSLAAIAINHPDFVFPGDPAASSRYRYYDSYRLIQQNKQEIVDKSLASIAVGFPSSFRFPDDPVPYNQNRYYDSSGLIQRNKQEIVDKSLAAVALQYDSYPTFYFPGDTETNSRSRYYDSYRLIQQNKQEIVDKALASIAVGYPSNFRFPTDPVPYNQNRYYDSSGLIQRNKQEIIDKSLAAVALEYTSYPDFYFPGDTETNPRSRYYDAYRLIQRNKTEIINSAWTNTVASYPGILSTQTKCKRDLGFFIDAISADIFTGGNNYAKEFALQYFDGAGNLIPNGLVDELTESVFAFNQAREFMKSAITNQLTYNEVGISSGPATYGGGGPNIANTSNGSCADVQSNINTLVSIVTNSIGSANTSLLPSPANLGTFTTGGAKCARDLGFLVDAIATDVFTGGTKYSREFVFQYYNGTSRTGIGTTELAPSIAAFSAARDYSKKAITNQLNVKNVGISSGPATYGGPGIAITVYPSGNPDSCTDVQNTIDTLVGIVTVGVGIGTSVAAGFPQTSNLGISTTNICARDLGYLVDAISTDVFTGGNKYSREFVFQYANGGIANPELAPSILAFSAARDYAKKAITNQLNLKDVGISSGPATYGGPGIAITVYPSGNPDSCTDVQANINTLVGIVTVGLGIGTGALTGFPQTINLGTFTDGGAKCARDLGFLVDAISTDVFTGGNKYSREFVFQYYNGTARTGIGTTELAPSIAAFSAAREYAKKAVTNQLNLKNLGISSGPATYGGPGSSIPVSPSGNANSCTDVQSTINTLVGIVTVGVGIGTSVAAGFPQTTNLGISTTNICARDLGYLVDAVSIDVFTGGNKYSRNFTNFYFNGATSVGIETAERLQSVYSFNSLRDYCNKAITNQLNLKDVGISSGPATYGGPGIGITVYPSGNPDSCTDVQQNINTLVGIVTTVIGSGSQSYLNTFSENPGTFLAGSSKCYRDIGYLVDAVSLDVRDYTNKNTRNFIKGYFDANGNPLINGITGEVAESISAFNGVRDYSKKAITNQLNAQDRTLPGDPTNTDPASCANVQTFIDNLIGAVTSNSVGVATSKLNLPAVSMGSTVFTVNVGVATQPHTYVPNTGTAKNNVIRPFDGQVIYFGDLYYTVSKVIVGSGGTGYTEKPTITITDPDTSWGVTAQAVSNISNGSVTSFDLISSGRGYTSVPKVTISSPNVGINTATATAILLQSYYPVISSTPISAGICTVTISENIPYVVTPGTEVPFYKQSRVLASGHSFEYIGSGTEIAKALPATGGVPIQDNEVDLRNGGLVVYTSTDQSGNFRIGEGVVVNQQSGTISGSFYSKSLFSTVTPFILALGG